MNDRRGDRPGWSPLEEQEIANLFQLAGAPDRVADDELPPIRAKAREAWVRQVRRTAARRRAVAASLAVAAAIALAVGLGLLRPSPPPSPVPVTVTVATLETSIGQVRIGGAVAPAAVGLPLASGTAIATGEDGRLAVRLAAGPSLRVDVGSTVRIVSASALRLERGAVYIDSSAPAAAGSSSLAIDTPLGRVTDVGTQFEVRLIEQENGGRAGAPAALRVSVREGAVQLETEEGRYHAPARSELLVRAGAEPDRDAAVPYGARWSWIESVLPPLEIEGARLESFLDWAARESGRSWRFAEPRVEGSLLDDVVHGSIAGLTVEEALETVLPSCGLRHRVAGDLLLIEQDQR